jgi:DNA-binding HxlR family transcriptional regulator
MSPNNTDQKTLSQNLILIALSDGQWHRIKELKENIKLSPRTLYKRLNELEKELKWIERREDTESGEYPYPVLYRATELILPIAIQIKTVHHNADNIEKNLKKTKDPLKLLDNFHILNLYYFSLLLETIQENKHMPQKAIHFMANLTIYNPYEIYVDNIIAEFIKGVKSGTHFDIDQLRQKRGFRTASPNQVLFFRDENDTKRTQQSTRIAHVEPVTKSLSKQK